MCWAVPEVCKRREGSMHIFRVPVMRTARPAYPLARQGLAASPRGRPGRGSGLGRGGEQPRSPRACDGFGAKCVFTPLPPAPRVAPRPAIPTREGGTSAASTRRSTRSPTG